MEVESVDSLDAARPYHNHPPGAACVALALVGPGDDLYEIYNLLGIAYYYVCGTQVTREVYLDCLATADKDRFCPHCDGGEEVAPAQEPS